MRQLLSRSVDNTNTNTNTNNTNTNNTPIIIPKIDSREDNLEFNEDTSDNAINNICAGIEAAKKIEAAKTRKKYFEDLKYEHYRFRPTPLNSSLLYSITYKIVESDLPDLI
jgi:hypothetical protein